VGGRGRIRVEDKRKEGKLKRRKRQGIKHGAGSNGKKQVKVYKTEEKRKEEKRGVGSAKDGAGRQVGGMGSAEG
jgi:hypothetical protein